MTLNSPEIICVNLRTGSVEATVQFPEFLYGLQPESLADLSWTDPALGVSPYGFWPAEYLAVEYNPDTHKISGYTYSPDPETFTVIATPTVTPLTPEELGAIAARKSQELQSWRNSCEVSPFRLQRALLYFGLLDGVEAVVAQASRESRIGWARATSFKRMHEMILAVQPVLQLTDTQMDEVFRKAESYTD